VEDFYAHIDAYKQGILKGELLVSFEQEMERNDSLRLAVDNYDVAKDISEGLLELDMMETLKQLKTQRDKTMQSQVKDNAKIIDLKESDTQTPSTFLTNWNWKKWLAAAAMIGLILISGWWFMDYRVEQQYIAQVQENYEWPEDPDATKSVDTVGMTDFEKGKFYFRTNNYKKSLPFLERHILREKDPKSLSEGYEWLGAVYVKLGMMDKAREALKKSREERAIRNMQLIRK